MISDCFQANKVVALTRENPDIRTYIILDAEFPGLTDGQERPFKECYDRFKLILQRLQSCLVHYVLSGSYGTHKA